MYQLNTLLHEEVRLVQLTGPATDVGGEGDAGSSEIHTTAAREDYAAVDGVRSRAAICLSDASSMWACVWTSVACVGST